MAFIYFSYERNSSMTDVYKRLAKKLDELPNGFPSTESGVELKILQKIFTPEDAELALKIRPIPETAAQIAERLGKPIDRRNGRAAGRDGKKGQIGSTRMNDQQVYLFFPFVFGIWEFQLRRLDKELAELAEEYQPSLMGGTFGQYSPAFIESGSGQHPDRRPAPGAAIRGPPEHS